MLSFLESKNLCIIERQTLNMLRYILLMAVCCFVQLAIAQKPASFRLTETTVVKDSSGQVYPYSVWSALMQSGLYSLKPEDPTNASTAFFIRRMSEDEIAKSKARQAKMEAEAPKPRESAFFATGKPISNFKTTDMYGNKYNLKELRGKVVVLNFWFVNCPPCKKEIPELNKIVAEYQQQKDVVFLAIALDDKAALEEFLKNLPFQYNIIDSGMFIAQQYRITSYPTHVVVDKEGIVKFHTTGLGLGTIKWLRSSIQEALQQ